MESLFRDVRSAVRRLAGQRGFTAAALVTLALGIGANTAMFSIAYGLLLRPLPYPDPEGLVRVADASGGRAGRGLTNRTLPLFEDAGSFEHLAAYRESSVQWTAPEGVVTLDGAAVSPALFPLLRATPHLGRLFSEEEAREGADGVVLLSHRAWTNRFAADPDIVGTPLTSTETPTPSSGCSPRDSTSRTTTASSGRRSSCRRSPRRRPRGTSRARWSSSASASSAAWRRGCSRSRRPRRPAPSCSAVPDLRCCGGRAGAARSATAPTSTPG